MSHLRITPSKQPAQFQPGEEISGAAQWQLDRVPQAVELRLLWYARGAGERKIKDVCVVETMRMESALQEETRPFRFTAPEAPYSFTGKLIALEWFLELVALPSEDNIRIGLEIAPGGETLILEHS